MQMNTADALEAPPTPSSARPIGDPRIGALIDGRYRLEARLGAGGMGVVYAARHDVTGRAVAVKLLHPQGQHSDEVIARFAREARTGAAIGHRNIVDVLDAGSLADGTPFLVMELLRGEALADRLCREHRLSPAAAGDIVLQAASALEALHEHGIIHRDVKTDNLFVDEHGCVKLLDFGLAVFTAGEVPGRVTKEGILNGTPEYMPSEVFDGHEPTVAWDVYALATVAFELLTGVVPFEGAGPLVLLYGKRESAAPRLGDLTEASFSEELELVIARGLHRTPSRRQPTPMAFALELVEALRDERSPATPRGSVAATPLALPLSRNARAGWIVAASSAIVLIAGLVVVLSEPAQALTTHARRAAPESRAPAFVVMAAPSAQTSLVPAAPPETIAIAPASESHASRGDARSAHSHGGPTVVSADPPPVEPDLPSAASPLPSGESARELVRQGTSALMRGMIPDALELLSRATVAAPDSAVAWRSLGLANERVGRRTEARRAYERYLTLAPSAADADEVRRRLATL